MSKIKLQGNDTGTGVFTIASPGTNTNRSLTLPDEAGTLLSSGGAIDVNASAPADSLSIDSSGNVLVGKTSADADTTGFQFESGGAGSFCRSGNVALYAVRNSSDGEIIQFRKDGAAVGSIASQSSGTQLSLETGSGNEIRVSASGGLLLEADREGNGGGGTMDFKTESSERMRIDSIGDIYAGEDYNSAPWNVTTAKRGLYYDRSNGLFCSMSASSAALLVSRTDSNGDVVIIYRSGSKVGSIDVGTSSTGFNSLSDYRAKENVVDMTGSIDRLKQLQPRRFNWIIDEDNTLIDGFIAHEVSDIVPEAVSGEKDAVEVWREGEELPEGVSVGDNKTDDEGNTIPDYQGIDQAKLVPLLTGALQEAITKIEALETRIETLENA